MVFSSINRIVCSVKSTNRYFLEISVLEIDIQKRVKIL
jgi:hypothetical protein